ncbi:MAG TPA: hypothetical protein VMS09_09860 [Paenibacillus sp.]|uniref:hypothetical protein n=1 Tax=Paenibacillus sp. TaxID=58172 RepID=UPI0028D17FEA|nr:hypothetical protein [Paenibacillus sp.]HUC92321.1 hypothetical protein [Paenibacillus sp.]
MAGFGGGLHTGLNANVDLHAGAGAHLGAGWGHHGYGYHCVHGYSSAGVILVLFILLVIIVRAYL